MIDADKLDEMLSKVQKPARYTGGELGEIKKDIDKDTLRFAFCFPDVYEVGMSHLGTGILYHLLNGIGGVSAERCFCPWPDMEHELKSKGVPLFSLETKTPLGAFDFLGFSLSYEMCYTNVLAMLSLAGIPFYSNERNENHPLVIAGGGCVYNPEPVADFFDLFVIGEAEESLVELLNLYKDCQRRGVSKNGFLTEAAGIEGIYVPSLYEPDYNEDGTVKSIKASGAPEKVKKRIVRDFDASYFPEFPIVPFVAPVHDRVTLEIMRGCTRGCRFCQAGFAYRPVRERSAERLFSQARRSVENTGHEEVSLCSLSTGDYSQVGRLVGTLADSLSGIGVSLSVPSLRIDSFEGGFAEQLKRVRNAGLTFAPEAGTKRLRDIINKNITDEEILSAVREAFETGSNAVKLYFMIGLPEETEEDIRGIADTVRRIRDAYYGVPAEKRRGGLRLTVSVSNFVPKAHTPFQWEPQDPLETLLKKQKLLISHFKALRGVDLKWHEAKLSLLEAVFSRGDRRLSKVIEEAFKSGCRFDGWIELFDFDKWMGAFMAAGLDPAFYANRKREAGEVMPWGMIDTGVSDEYLQNERKKAFDAKTTPDCRAGCLNCGLREAGLCV